MNRSSRDSNPGPWQATMASKRVTTELTVPAGAATDSAAFLQHRQQPASGGTVQLGEETAGLRPHHV